MDCLAFIYILVGVCSYLHVATVDTNQQTKLKTNKKQTLKQTLTHLFVSCSQVKKFWSKFTLLVEYQTRWLYCAQ